MIWTWVILHGADVGNHLLDNILAVVPLIVVAVTVLVARLRPQRREPIEDTGEPGYHGDEPI